MPGRGARGGRGAVSGGGQRGSALAAMAAAGRWPPPALRGYSAARARSRDLTRPHVDLHQPEPPTPLRRPRRTPVAWSAAALTRRDAATYTPSSATSAAVSATARAARWRPPARAHAGHRAPPARARRTSSPPQPTSTALAREARPRRGRAEEGARGRRGQPGRHLQPKGGARARRPRGRAAPLRAPASQPQRRRGTDSRAFAQGSPRPGNP